jgi:hypothetical protein
LAGGVDQTPQDAERLQQLQSYLLRDFVESLFGLTDTLRQSVRSPRSFELALVGDFSPVSLAEQVAQAFHAGRRSPTAAAFQFTELLRVVVDLPLEGQEPLSPRERDALEEIRTNGIARLLAIVRAAVGRGDFHRACCDGDFSRYVAASLPPRLVKEWTGLIQADGAIAAASPNSPPSENAFS